jgi:hypothetical protein
MAIHQKILVPPLSPALHDLFMHHHGERCMIFLCTITAKDVCRLCLLEHAFLSCFIIGVTKIAGRQKEKRAQAQKANDFL